MKTIAVKRRKLIDEINRSQNERLLDEFYLFIQKDNQLEDVYCLSDDQKDAIAIAREQIKNGQIYDNEEVENEIRQWLEEQYFQNWLGMIEDKSLNIMVQGR